jgi:tetratricopeptide (TPR) repeat protein
MSVHLWEETVAIPTYPVGKPNPHPPLQRNGYWSVYPYPLRDALSDEAEPREYRVVMLENPYLRVMVLPELGGRVWSLYDKIAGRECLHQPPSIKPALIGLTGAWIAGGIEFNFPIGHRYTTHQPVWYTLSYPKEEQEKATIWLGEVCRRSRMMWMVGISLYPHRALLETDIRLFNRTELKKRFYFWTNCAVSAHEQWKWILPASSVRNWEGDLSEARATLPFPIADDGTDLSLYRSYDRASSVFAHDFRGGFFGGYDLREDAGLLHVADPRDARGRKLFTWGTADDGLVWAERLDDRGVPYVEIQTGRFEDQSIWHWIPPHSLECWQEAWYPIRGLKGTVAAATLDGALGAQWQGQQLQVRFHSTAPRPDHRLLLQYGEEVVHEQRVDLYPERPGSWQFTLPEQVQRPLKVIIATASRETVIEATANPVTEREQLTIRPAPTGDDAQTLFLQADALERAALLDEAEAKYRQALEKLPDYLPALNALARMCLEDGRWEECLRYTERALRRDAQNGEAMYLRALCLCAQGRDAEAEEWLYPLRRNAEYRGLAYYLLAICALRRRDYARADDLLAECLLYNAADIKAWMMRAVALRLQGEVEEAAQVRLQVHLLAPLEPLLRTEAYLSTPESPDGDAVNLLKPLAMQTWGFEEVACDYLNAGCATDAIRVLEASAHLGLPEHAMTHYLLALAYHQKRLPAQVAEHALLATRAQTCYLFPWRLEDVHAIQTVLAVKPNDVLARYALGNWLAAHRRWEDALREWFRALDTSSALEADPLRALAERCLQVQPPKQAIAPTLYRNIGLALSKGKGWHDLALRYYEHALALSPDDHYLWLERDVVAQRAGVGAETRQQWLEQAGEAVLHENRVAQLHAYLLVQTRRYDAAIEVLHSRIFHVAEGETSTRRVWVEAHIGKGKNLARQGDWQSALEQFQQALEYSPHLAVGKPSRPADAVPFFWAGVVARKLGQEEQARRYWQEAAGCVAYTDQEKAHQAMALQLLGRDEDAYRLAQPEGVAQEVQRLKEEMSLYSI